MINLIKGLDKNGRHLQTTFRNTFSWEKTFELWFLVSLKFVPEGLVNKSVSFEVMDYISALTIAKPVYELKGRHSTDAYTPVVAFTNMD